MDKRLYEYVRRVVLSEALSQSDYALYRVEQGDRRVGIVYNARNITNLIKLGDKSDIASAVEEKIIGGIGIKKPDDPCADAWEVTNSVGKGQGKLVYALGFFLSPTNRLMPDRNSVSKDAFAGWAKQVGRSKKPLDNVKKPRNRDMSDDCEVWGTEDGKIVDNSYAGDSAGFDFDGMMQRHEDALAEFQKHKLDFEDMLMDAFVAFWTSQYKGNVRLKKNPDGTVSRTPLQRIRLCLLVDDLPVLRYRDGTSEHRKTTVQLPRVSLFFSTSTERIPRLGAVRTNANHFPRLVRLHISVISRPRQDCTSIRTYFASPHHTLVT